MRNGFSMGGNDLFRGMRVGQPGGSLAEDSPASPSALVAPPVVYVSDFDLDAANVAPDSGPGHRARGILGHLMPEGPLRQRQDPQARAREIVALMAQSLTDDLKKAGVDARRVTPGEPLPHNGWQVRGVFLSIDEGNRLRRAMVGMGAGQSQFQVAVSCDNLATPDLPPLYESVEEGASRDMPGAVVKLNPYVIAAKVVLSGRDEKAAVRKSAEQIADELAKRLQAGAR
ncbi:DUF4410 domain-containing protein [Paraburkholderia sp. MMS20-SJTN17]|uniref:DUF4410 domain-containing protein n=1 Tax=Paraburkholderia translucens TaxID=2886945 RepID=A0ABS8KEV2_9BURK|nr:DUF4410 domain-containing protein [Paraburkholderia sp. MMS20-SJTN17]MCC8402927.1 DUF4410 domain-containing protein [Paraburkholderia sp. MMS20-SJTN17]